MKVTLVQPAMGHRQGKFVASWKMEPLSIAVLAGLTADRYELSFVDDRLEPVPYERPADLVGISTETYTARRSYQIASEYRKRGAKVVIGGFHATLMTQEVLEHADAVVVGEAEEVWPRLLVDAEQGKLGRIYQGAQRPPLTGIPADRSILKGKKYLPLTLIESGRGCEFGCNFCSISSFYQKSANYRLAQDVTREIALAGRKNVFLVDDNIVADFKRAQELFESLTPLGINWLSQGAINMAKNTSLLRAMQKSGCAGLLIGFESLSRENLVAMNKPVNQLQKGFDEAIERIRDHGIKIYATFVFGYDHDTPELFEQTYEFACRHKFFVAAFNHLQPFPGTPLYEKMKQEKRLLYDRWWLEPNVHFGDIIFRPKHMEPAELFERLMNMRRRYFSYAGIATRATDLKANLASLTSAGYYFLVNAMLRKELNQKWGLPIGEQAN